MAAGLLAAALFGLSAPLTSELIGDSGVLATAGLLYAGATIALTLVAIIRRTDSPPFTRSDGLPLAGVILLGGVVGPVLLVTGLQRLDPEFSALLLNLEAPATIALGLLFFGDHLGRVGAVAAATTVVGAVVLTTGPSGPIDPVGVIAIAGACLAWGLDNNFSQRLSLADPVRIAQVKAVGASVPVLLLALVIGESFPTPGATVALLGIGMAAYGLSIVLDLHALRRLGSAREAAVFATGPFLGAAFAVIVLGQPLTWTLLIAGGLMAIGVLTLALESHEHEHVHVEIEHDHVHRHDDGEHDHVHAEPVSGRHRHVHRHEARSHRHAHLPDAHHRHDHP